VKITEMVCELKEIAFTCERQTAANISFCIPPCQVKSSISHHKKQFSAASPVNAGKNN
jgi:hypothetical protein